MSADQNKLEAALYLVPTPIGNLRDITLRALDVLRGVDAVACEDTRVTGRLLSLLGVQAPTLISCHAHSEKGKASHIASMIAEGKSVAFCSDAGTPCISDPGFALVRESIQRGITIIPLPGASAAITALIASGLDASEYYFAGFVPQKKSRQSFLDRITSMHCTVVLYESSHRILKLLGELEQRCADRRVCVARELTKLYEEFLRGTVQEVNGTLQSRSAAKGEFVVILQARDE